MLMTRASAPSGSSAAASAQATAVAPELVQLAHSLADAAAAVTSRYFRTPVPVDVKSDASPVTIADKEAEAAMRQLIAQQVGGLVGAAFGLLVFVLGWGCSERFPMPNDHAMRLPAKRHFHVAACNRP